jgi:large subunit ribosomal protein L3
MTTGIIGKKLGMTQVFDAQGRVVPVTVIEAGPCTIVQRKTRQNDGYDAVQLGFGAKKAHGVSKPMLGHIQKAGKGAFRTLRELRIDSDSSLEVGQEIRVDIFQAGEYVDVTGQTKGRGFAGVVKRWGFKGGRGSHGSMFHRAPGSIGGSSFPSRVFKNMKMGGHYGNERVTVLNLQVFSIQPEKNLLSQRNARIAGIRLRGRGEDASSPPGGRRPAERETIGVRINEDEERGCRRRAKAVPPEGNRALPHGNHKFPLAARRRDGVRTAPPQLRTEGQPEGHEGGPSLRPERHGPGRQNRARGRPGSSGSADQGVPEGRREARNLKSFKSLPVSALNVYDILSHEQLVLTRPAFEKISEVLRK